jgi:hypothetical protein
VNVDDRRQIAVTYEGYNVFRMVGNILGAGLDVLLGRKSWGGGLRFTYCTCSETLGLGIGN